MTQFVDLPARNRLFGALIGCAFITALPALGGELGGVIFSLIGMSVSAALALCARRAFVLTVVPAEDLLKIRGSFRTLDIAMSSIESVDLTDQMIGWRRRRSLDLVLKTGRRVLVGSRFGIGGEPDNPVDRIRLESIAEQIGSRVTATP